MKTAKYVGGLMSSKKLNFLPGLIEQQVRVSLVVTSVENCSGGELDLVYSVFTTQIAPVLSRTFESYQSEKFAPERAAGYRRGNKSLALFSVGCLWLLRAVLRWRALGISRCQSAIEL